MFESLEFDTLNADNFTKLEMYIAKKFKGKTTSKLLGLDILLWDINVKYDSGRSMLLINPKHEICPINGCMNATADTTLISDNVLEYYIPINNNDKSLYARSIECIDSLDVEKALFDHLVNLTFNNTDYSIFYNWAANHIGGTVRWKASALAREKKYDIKKKLQKVLA